MKYLKYILILIILSGLFSFVSSVHSSVIYPNEACNASVNPTNQPCVQPSNVSTQNGYVLLAPLPGVPPGFDPGQQNALGTYLNAMIKIFIGICAVLSVVMIVVGGLQYMTSELISGKGAGLERIKNALWGLLIALGAYALLFTINPDLLNTNVALPNATVSVTLQPDIDSGPPSITRFSGTLPSGSVAACPTGVTQSAATGIVACSSIGASVDQMVAAAKQAGVNISGGGFRTANQQIALRIKNCNGNITDASAPCSPPTAVAGHSEHESGLAFDMTCNGATIQASDNACFLWLQNNAGSYGLKNLPSEPWHWSIDGH